MYGDDIVFFSETIEGLQRQIDMVYDYCNIWKLTVNLVKTKILVCRGGGPLSHNEVWFWGENLIDICQEYKYLGITFRANGIVNKSLDYVASQGMMALFALRYRLKQKGKAPVGLCIKLFHKVIVPVLSYASAIWGFRKAHTVSKVALQYYKHLLGVKMSTKSTAVYTELGELPLQVLFKFNVIKYWVEFVPNESYMLRKKI